MLLSAGAGGGADDIVAVVAGNFVTDAVGTVGVVAGAVAARAAGPGAAVTPADAADVDMLLLAVTRMMFFCCCCNVGCFFRIGLVSASSRPWATSS